MAVGGRRPLGALTLLGALASGVLLLRAPATNEHAETLPATHPLAQVRADAREAPLASIVLGSTESGPPDALDALVRRLVGGLPAIAASGIRRSAPAGDDLSASDDALAAAAARLLRLRPLLEAPADASLASLLDLLGQLGPLSPDDDARRADLLDVAAQLLREGKAVPTRRVAGAALALAGLEQPSPGTRVGRAPKPTGAPGAAGESPRDAAPLAAPSPPNSPVGAPSTEVWLRGVAGSGDGALLAAAESLVARLRTAGLSASLSPTPPLRAERHTASTALRALVPLALVLGALVGHHVGRRRWDGLAVGAATLAALAPAALALVSTGRAVRPLELVALAVGAGAVAAIGVVQVARVRAAKLADEPPLLSLRHALRETTLGALVGSSTLAAAAVGAWSTLASRPSAWILGLVALGLLLAWGALLPGLLFAGPDPRRRGPSGSAQPAGRALDAVHVAWVVAGVGVCVGVALVAHRRVPPGAPAGLSLHAVVVPAGEAFERRAALEGQASVREVYGPERRSTTLEAGALSFRSAVSKLGPPGPARAQGPSVVDAPEDTGPALVALAALGGETEASSRRLAAQLGALSEGEGWRRLYYAEAALRTGLQSLRAELVALDTTLADRVAGKSEADDDALYRLDAGRVALVVRTEVASGPSSFAAELAATARQDSLPVAVAAGLSLVLLTAAGLLSAGRRFGSLWAPALLAVVAGRWAFFGGLGDVVGLVSGAAGATLAGLSWRVSALRLQAPHVALWAALPLVGLVATTLLLLVGPGAAVSASLLVAAAVLARFAA